MKTLEVRFKRIDDSCKAEVHDEPVYTYSFHEYIPPEGQEELAGTIGSDIVQGNKITVRAPGRYGIWFETHYHSRVYRSGYYFEVG